MTDLVDAERRLNDATPEEWDKCKGSYYMTDTSKASQKQVGGGHYVEKSIQPWDYIVANNLGYLEGNVVKYVTRYKSKNGKQDLEKALHYLQKLLEVQK